jgi:hypothetical protein
MWTSGVYADAVIYNNCSHIHKMRMSLFDFLHPHVFTNASMRLLSVICILSNELILVFLTFFMSLWEPILSDFKNNMGWFLVFQACFNFFKALMFWKYFNFTLNFFFFVKCYTRKQHNQPNPLQHLLHNKTSIK